MVKAVKRIEQALILGVIVSGCSSWFSGVAGLSTPSLVFLIIWMVLSILSIPVSIFGFFLGRHYAVGYQRSLILFLLSTLPGLALLVLGLLWF